MPVGRIYVVFDKGSREATRYAYSNQGGNVTGNSIASLAENPKGDKVSELYCAPLEVENELGEKKIAYQVKVLLEAPTTETVKIGVNVFDEKYNLVSEVFDKQNGFPAGEKNVHAVDSH